MVVGGCYSGLSGHKSKKVTSSEWSASQICRVKGVWWRVAEGTPKMLIVPMPFAPFSTTAPRHRTKQYRALRSIAAHIPGVPFYGPFLDSHLTLQV